METKTSFLEIIFPVMKKPTQTLAFIFRSNLIFLRSNLHVFNFLLKPNKTQARRRLNFWVVKNRIINYYYFHFKFKMALSITTFFSLSLSSMNYLFELSRWWARSIFLMTSAGCEVANFLLKYESWLMRRLYHFTVLAGNHYLEEHRWFQMH